MTTKSKSEFNPGPPPRCKQCQNEMVFIPYGPKNSMFPKTAAINKYAGVWECKYAGHPTKPVERPKG